MSAHLAVSVYPLAAQTGLCSWLLGERWLDAFSKALTGLRFVKDLQISDRYMQNEVCCIQAFVGS